ncbi:hypothetical protein GQ600_24009 [Phytophthora cactorum]|nr:hypothetical protein GQ600_24009 [Phytophthora cactorum]
MRSSEWFHFAALTSKWLRLQNHTHSHPTSSTEASSYLTTKTLPLDDEDREDVRTLADARVSSAASNLKNSAEPIS